MEATDREAFDALLDEVDGVDLNEPDTARLLSAVEVPGSMRCCSHASGVGLRETVQSPS